MNNDDKLAALANEPLRITLGEDNQEFTLRRPTIKSYRRIRAFIQEHKLDDRKPTNDEALEFGVFFVANLLKDPPMTQDQLEEIMLISDLEKLKEVMDKMGFKKPQQSPTEQTPADEVPEENETLTGADSTQESLTEQAGA